MHRNDTSAIALTPATLPVIKDTGRAAEQEFLVDLHDFIGPKLLRIQDVSGEELSRNSPGKVFNCFTANGQSQATRLNC